MNILVLVALLALINMMLKNLIFKIIVVDGKMNGKSAFMETIKNTS